MTQLFVRKPPIQILMNILAYGIENNNIYEMDYETYKKIKYKNYDKTWLMVLGTYYYKSKQMYIEREFTYVSFITLLRHLCRFFNLDYRYEHDPAYPFKYRKFIVTV